MYQYDLAKQSTHPLLSLSLHDYLQHFRLSWADVAQRAGVPVAVVWRVDRGLAVTSQHAELVRSALSKIAGFPFVGYILTTEQ